MNDARRIVARLLEFYDEAPLPEPAGGPGRHSVRVPMERDDDLLISVLKELYPDGNIPDDVRLAIMGPELKPGERPGPDDDEPQAPPHHPRF